MLFNSWQFGVFLPVVFFLHWFLPEKFRMSMLLIASLYFYMSWNTKYIFLILFTTLVSYFAAILLERFQNNSHAKKLLLVLTLFSCLGVLFVFKYFNFFADVLTKFFGAFSIQLHPVTLKLLLPVGISFYTFQTLSYVIDVYRGSVKTEHNFIAYATFISFFPQLVAGPIERTNNLLPQIKAHREFNYEQATYGLKLMAWGFFKKLAIADFIAIWVDHVYEDVYSYTGFALMLATFFFTIQIYCDFSGYSDIARGTAKLLGIDLMENFRSPYFSASIKEFWSRWHISLSTWFRDYVYIPMGGNRVAKARNYINLMIVFMISGLWHGANWTFVIWGAVHGFAQIIEKILTGKKISEPHGLKWLLRVLITFTFCMFAWVFFRAQNMNEVFYVFVHSFDGISNINTYLLKGVANIKAIQYGLKHFVFVLSILAVYDYLSYFSVAGKPDTIEIISRQNKFVRWSFYILIGLVLVLFSPKGVATEFVYFQF